MSVLEYVEDKNRLIEYEQFYLDLFEPEYNHRKIADSNLGMKYSIESCNKIGASKRGKKLTEEHKRKISIGGIGKHFQSDAHRLIMLQTHKGKVISPEIRLTMSQSSTCKKAVLCVETGVIYESSTKAQNLLGINHSDISCCCTGYIRKSGYKYLTAGGFHWEFYKD